MTVKMSSDANMEWVRNVLIVYLHTEREKNASITMTIHRIGVNNKYI